MPPTAKLVWPLLLLVLLCCLSVCVGTGWRVFPKRRDVFSASSNCSSATGRCLYLPSDCFISPPLTCSQSTAQCQKVGMHTVAFGLMMLMIGPAAFRSMRIFTLRRWICRLLRNLLLAGEKSRIATFLLHIHLIQDFSGSFLILPFIKR